MPPTLALFLWLILLLALLRFDPAKDSGTLLALWVPLIWMFIVGSRLPSQWLGVSERGGFEAGDPIDRSIDLVLIVLAIGILIARSFNWGGFFTRNVALVVFLFFALISVFWSDFPFVCFKRWFRDLGNYFVILVVLSDPRPLEAGRTLLRRLCYLLIPLSILLIKYYPLIAKQYEPWSGAAEFVGATTSKNMLGVLCLVSGIFFFWDTVTRWPERKERRTKRILLVNFAFIGMTLWLLTLSNSATSRVCLVIGCLVILATCSKTFKRHPDFLKVLIPMCFILYVVLAFGFDLNGRLASLVGRDPTLTDRTDLWKILLSMNTNPLVGTGYESFWLGPRLLYVWQHAFVGANEAHNGYLEIYLNLGLIGGFLLGGFLISGYRKICKRLAPGSNLASLNLAVWAIMLFYNMTEAGFKGGLLWLMLLLGAVIVPESADERVPAAAAFGNVRVAGRLRGIPRELTGFRKSCPSAASHPTVRGKAGNLWKSAAKK
jgi:exopolysaccharide production protein ExoQ